MSKQRFYEYSYPLDLKDLREIEIQIQNLGLSILEPYEKLNFLKALIDKKSKLKDKVINNQFINNEGSNSQGSNQLNDKIINNQGSNQLYNTGFVSVGANAPPDTLGGVTAPHPKGGCDSLISSEEVNNPVGNNLNENPLSDKDKSTLEKERNLKMLKEFEEGLKERPKV